MWVRIPLRWGVLDTTLCDIVCKWLAAGLWFSLGTLVSFTNKTDRNDITEILLKVALNTITQTLTPVNTKQDNMKMKFNTINILKEINGYQQRNYEKKVWIVKDISSTNINKKTKQSAPLILTEFAEHKKDHDIWCWKSKSWLETCTKVGKHAQRTEKYIWLTFNAYTSDNATFPKVYAQYEQDLAFFWKVSGPKRGAHNIILKTVFIRTLWNVNRHYRKFICMRFRYRKASFSVLFHSTCK